MPKITDAQYVTDVNGTGYIIGYQDGVFCRWPVSIFSANNWLSGTGVPNVGLGINSDLYLDTETGDVYSKNSNLWGDPITNIRGADGAAGVSPKEILYSVSGPLAVSEGKLKRYISTAHTISSIKILLGSAASGSVVKFDLLKNGISHSVFDTEAEIPADVLEHTINTFTNNTLSVGDYLTVNISQVGSAASGANLTMMIILN